MTYKISNKYKCKTGNNLSRRTAKPLYIVVHYTGSGSPKKGTAYANCQYFNRANRNASADFFIDNGTIARYNPNCAKYYSWHCGDGHGKYGITNARSIGIEVCQDGDRPYTGAEKKRLRWLVQQLQKKYGIPDGHVVRHYDASRKECPYYYTPSGSGGSKAWTELHAYLTK